MEIDRVSGFFLRYIQKGQCLGAFEKPTGTLSLFCMSEYKLYLGDIYDREIDAARILKAVGKSPCRVKRGEAVNAALDRVSSDEITVAVGFHALCRGVDDKIKLIVDDHVDVIR